MPLIQFNANGLPNGSTVSINPTPTGADMVIKMDSHTNFPHVTFHASSAARDATGLCKAMFVKVARFHVAVRAGVYVGRQYEAGWKDDPSDTTERIMGSDKASGMSMALDIEQILKVS